MPAEDSTAPARPDAHAINKIWTIARTNLRCIGFIRVSDSYHLLPIRIVKLFLAHTRATNRAPARPADIYARASPDRRTGAKRRQRRVLLERLAGHDLDLHRGDVVADLAIERGAYQLFGRRLVGVLRQRGGDRRLVERLAQAVAAQQETIAGQHLAG